MDIIIEVKNKIREIYEELKKLPKPERTQIGGTYYGSTQLFSSVGNHLALIDDETYTKYCYGGSVHYNHLWGIRIGGAYKEDLHKELMNFIRENAEEIHKKGYSIIEDYGTNYCTYGIALR